MYYTINEFGQAIGVSAPTLRLWHSSGRLVPALITNGGQRRYSQEQVDRYLNIFKTREPVIWGSNQAELTALQELYPNTEVTVCDRWKLYDMILTNTVSKITMLHEDEFLEYLCKHFNVKLVKLGGDADVQCQQV